MLTRTFDLTDLSVRSEGEGRTVVAYAAVFDTPVEIQDQDGHYIETIDRSAFNRSVMNNEPSHFRALFNHGMSLHGTPSERFTMPWGVVTHVQPDARGLITHTRASTTPLGEEILTLAKDGALKGFSFSARSLDSESRDPLNPDGLPSIHRLEFALTEFGPAVFPAYPDAELVGVRSLAGTSDVQGSPVPTTDLVAEELAPVDSKELAQLRAKLSLIPRGDKQ